MSSLTRVVQRIKSKKTELFPSYTTLADVVIPQAYTVTCKGKQFLMYDSNDGKDRLLMFTTKKNLRFLTTCSVWASDGTFKVTPLIFTQLYTIHGMKNGKTFPLVYYLLPNKSKKIYKKALKALKDLIDQYEPDEIIFDFELAFIKTFCKLFPRVHVHGCYYHFKQSVWRNVQSNGLQTLYTENIQFMMAVKMLTALTFVPTQDVIFAYESLISSYYFLNNEDLLSDLLDYFEHTWIGQKKRDDTRRDPIYSIELWNNYEAVLNDLPRTNNGVEGWNHRFANVVNNYHCKLEKLIESLKLEQNTVDVLISQYKAGMEIAPSKRLKNKNYDLRLKNVILNYNRNNIIEYLRNVAILIVL